MMGFNLKDIVAFMTSPVVESKFYTEGALGELNPTLKTVLDILKGISSVRGR